LIDLGRWLDEDQGIPLPPSFDDEYADENGDGDWGG
jgi:endogenous inhibitor of DNA gyrase (YacG/DUF329 family)